MASFQIINHSKRICSLYKQTLRTIDAIFLDNREEVYYYNAVVRNMFDKNKDVKDPTKIEKLISDIDKFIFSFHEIRLPHKFPQSPGGCAFQRDVIPPDWVLDYWHPLEKAAYPHYFATREKRKKEYLELWDKAYGKPKSLQDH